MTEHELSPTDWVRKQTEQILAQGTTDGVQILDRPVVMYQVDGAAHGGLLPPRVFDVPGSGGGDAEKLDLAAPGEMAVASWVAANGEAAGATTDTLREARCLYLPIRSKDRVFGVAGLVMEQGDDDFGSFERNLLVALLDECGQAAEALALAAKDGPFISKDDIAGRAKVSRSTLDVMGELGLLGDLPESNQLSLFDMVM